MQRIIQRLAASRPASWFLPRVLPAADSLALRLSSGKRNLTGLMTGLPVVLVTATGAKSGKPRTSPLLAIPDQAHPERFALIASNWGQPRYPAWYFNLKADPRALCAIDGKSELLTAREATGAEYERFWELACEMYAGYRLYKERASGRQIPIMVMEPLSHHGTE